MSILYKILSWFCITLIYILKNNNLYIVTILIIYMMKQIKEAIKKNVYFIKCIYDYYSYLKVIKKKANKINKLNTNI